MRTYYGWEMGCASYPCGEILVQTRKPARKASYTVRARTGAEAAELIAQQLNAERLEAIREVEERENALILAEFPIR